MWLHWVVSLPNGPPLNYPPSRRRINTNEVASLLKMRFIQNDPSLLKYRSSLLSLKRCTPLSKLTMDPIPIVGASVATVGVLGGIYGLAFACARQSIRSEDLGVLDLESGTTSLWHIELKKSTQRPPIARPYTSHFLPYPPFFEREHCNSTGAEPSFQTFSGNGPGKEDPHSGSGVDSDALSQVEASRTFPAVDSGAF